jgi:hypothetical protein
MSPRSNLKQHYDLVGQLQPVIHQPQHAPSSVSHAFYQAYMRAPHDVGGEPDVPILYEEKEEEAWELNTYVTCEVLAWRGCWNAEERRRRGNNDVGQTAYLGLPYYGRWILAAARMLVDKNFVTLTELMAKIEEVRARNAKP